MSLSVYRIIKLFNFVNRTNIDQYYLFVTLLNFEVLEFELSINIVTNPRHELSFEFLCRSISPPYSFFLRPTDHIWNLPVLLSIYDWHQVFFEWFNIQDWRKFIRAIDRAINEMWPTIGEEELILSWLQRHFLTAEVKHDLYLA